MLPLFLFTPDVPKRLAVGAAMRKGLATLADTLRRCRASATTALFLLANMIYADGLVALFAFGGIYAAGTFGWGTIEIGVFGILLTITGTIGAFVGGKLDDRFGPKPVILGSLALLIFAGSRFSRSAATRSASSSRWRRRRRAAGFMPHGGAGLCRARPAHRHRRRAAAGGVAHAAGAARAAGPRHAIFRAVRAVRQGHVVHGAVAGRDRHRRRSRARKPAWRCWSFSSSAGMVLLARVRV